MAILPSFWSLKWVGMSKKIKNKKNRELIVERGKELNFWMVNYNGKEHTP